MEYQEAWSYLDGLQFFKIKLGLESMTAFLQKVGNPQHGLQFIHVAGTNGKGSVSATLLALLAGAGYRVGLYTSPHLSSVRERFRINDQYISRSDFAKLATLIRDSLDGGQITYFEFTTALALLWFAREKVDLVILEVGLGGRLDATNVITPLVSVITNVSMDHEAHLGTTLAQIAAEKAGIIKPGVPVVSGVAPDDSREVVSRVCREQGAPLFLLGRDFFLADNDRKTLVFHGPRGLELSGLCLAMQGSYQIDNTAIALATLDLLQHLGFPVAQEGISSSLLAVRWPGRLEYFQRPLITGKDGEGRGETRRYLLDGAHNPAGVASLRQSLESDFVYQRLICVWASMGDKDITATLTLIAPCCDVIIFTRPESERSATTAELCAILPEALRSRTICREKVGEALICAEEEARADDLICVAGSLYLIGAARKILLGELVDEP
ncbi:MAG: bifunctional folylpolyglutamate synthase/dihydrofolate synthase [Thermodesulfobacteriota bacterium]